jgi:hypothetical protein
VQPTVSSEIANQSARPLQLADARAARILAKTLYRELREGGLSHAEVLAVSTELLGLVTSELREERD